MPREVKKVSWAEYIKEFDASIHDAVANARKKPDVLGIACIVCEVLDSSWLGHKWALAYGPNNTYKSIDDMLSLPGGIYPTGLPSSASFPTVYTEDLPS